MLLAFKDIGESFIKPILYWSEGDHLGCAFEVRKRLSTLTEELKKLEHNIQFAISTCPAVFEHAYLLAALEDAPSLEVYTVHTHTHIYIYELVYTIHLHCTTPLIIHHTHVILCTVLFHICNTTYYTSLIIHHCRS